MIRAAFDVEDGNIVLSVCGHANYVERGSDIVCAAVSGIFYSLMGYLIACHKENTQIGRIEHGYAHLKCPIAAEEAIKQTCIGFLQIQNTYPECVEVTNNVWDAFFATRSV